MFSPYTSICIERSPSEPHMVVTEIRVRTTKQHFLKHWGLPEDEMPVPSEGTNLKIGFTVLEAKEYISLVSSWFHDNAPWFAESSDCWKEAHGRGLCCWCSAKVSCRIYVPKKRKGSYWLEQRAIASACAMLCLLSRLNYCFCQAVQENLGRPKAARGSPACFIYSPSSSC